MSEHSASFSAIRTLSAALCAGAAFGFAGGCIIVNKQHCGYTEAGADNPCPEGYVCSVCAVDNNGCVPIEQKDSIKAECLMGGGTVGTTTAPTTVATDPTDATTIAPPTSTSTGVVPGTDTDTTTTGTDTSASETTSTDTTESSSTTMPVECMGDIVDETCAPKYCLPSGVCGGCDHFPDGTTCAGLFPDQPVCDAGSGVCAECSAADTSHCPVDKPACDAATGTCTKCTEHVQCPDTACDIETGKCFPKDRVYYVKAPANCPGDVPAGTLADPFCALSQVPLGPEPTTIKIISTANSPGELSVPPGAVVAITREGNQYPILTGSLGPTLQLSGAGSRVYTWRVHFRDGIGSIISCNSGAHLWLHDTVLFSNNMDDAKAIDASVCQVRVVRTRIDDCGAGIRIANGDLRVESSFLISNGNSGAYGAFNFVGDVTARVVFSTIVLNHANPSAFTCTGLGSKDVVVRNSAVVGLAPLASDQCVLYDSSTVKEAADMNEVDATMAAWFTKHANGSYPPKQTMGLDPLEEKAVWAPGDPIYDFTMDPIPQQGSVWAGAEQPPP